MFFKCLIVFTALLVAPQLSHGLRVCVRYRSSVVCYTRSPAEDLLCHKNGKHYEGDMILTEEQRVALITSEYNASDYRWPTFTIPVQFNESHTSDENAEILSAINSIESVSCVRFVNRTDESNYVQVTASDDGCYAQVGYQESEQVLNLGSECFQKRTIQHLLLHVLGFAHIHSTNDRDHRSIMRCNYHDNGPHGHGSNRTLSEGDIKRINDVYQCN